MFKIGDKIRSVDEAERINGKLVIKSWAYGTIVDIMPEHDNSGLLYRVDWDEGGYDWLCAFELTKLKEATRHTMPKYSVSNPKDKDYYVRKFQTFCTTILGVAVVGVMICALFLMMAALA